MFGFSDTHQFDLFCTSTICQIWTYYWSRNTGRSTVLIEEKSVGRSTEKVQLMRTRILYNFFDRRNFGLSLFWNMFRNLSSEILRLKNHIFGNRFGKF